MYNTYFRELVSGLFYLFWWYMEGYGGSWESKFYKFYPVCHVGLEEGQTAWYDGNNKYLVS